MTFEFLKAELKVGRQAQTLKRSTFSTCLPAVMAQQQLHATGCYGDLLSRSSPSEEYKRQQFL